MEKEHWLKSIEIFCIRTKRVFKKKLHFVVKSDKP